MLWLDPHLKKLQNCWGLIKFHQFTIPFIILLLFSIVLAFISWRKGSQPSAYLCLSFLLPFLTVPIAVISYLIFNGFNWYFWSVVQPSAGLLFLGMFITFGFSVAQGMNDLKQEYIDKQLELNNELESKVTARTADLKKTSEKLITTNKDLTKIIICNLILLAYFDFYKDLKHQLKFGFF